MDQQRLDAVDVQYTLEEEQKVIEGQNAAIQKAIELEQQRQAELKRQQEEELKKQAEEEDSNKKKWKTKQQVATERQAVLAPVRVLAPVPAPVPVVTTGSSIYCTCFFKQLYSTNTRCCNIWFWISNSPCAWW